MTASDAKTLSDSRKTETWIDNTLRTIVYPAVELVASSGGTGTDCLLAPLMGSDLDTDQWHQQVEDLATALGQQGYQTEIFWSEQPSDGDRVTVRVSW